MTVAEGQAGLRLVALPRRLDAALRRARADRLLATLTTAIVVALVAFGFLEFATVSFGVPLDLTGRVAVASILGLAVAAVGTAADIFASPGRLGIARRADSRFDLGERLSTAIEVADRGGDAGAPVARALLADAERCAGSLDPRALVTVPYGRYAVAVAAAAVFAAISLAPPDSTAGGPAPAPAPTFAELTATEAAETGAELRRVAAILNEDAAIRDDPFLRALAREALQIGDEIEAGRLTDRDAVVAALDRLAGLTAEAYPPATVLAPDYDESDVITERQPEATQVLRDLARERMTPPSSNETGTRTQDQPLVEPAGSAAADIPPMMGRQPPTADVPNPQAPAGADGQQPTGGAPGAADDEGYLEAADMETFNDPTNYRAERTASERPENAQLIGPADAANTGQSRFAGVGQQMLNGAMAADDPFAFGADMLLNGPIDETGRRIRVEVPPEMQAIAIDAGEATATDWTTLRQVEVQRIGVPLGARDLLARYFRAAAEAE